MNDWQERAACLDKTWMSAPRGRTAEARAVCQACPVLRPCRAWILSDEGIEAQIPGVIAGMTPEQRDLVVCKSCDAVVSKHRSRKGQCWSCYTQHDGFTVIDEILERVS